MPQTDVRSGPTVLPRGVTAAAELPFAACVQPHFGIGCPLGVTMIKSSETRFAQTNSFRMKVCNFNM